MKREMDLNAAAMAAAAHSKMFTEVAYQDARRNIRLKQAFTSWDWAYHLKDSRCFQAALRRKLILLSKERGPRGGTRYEVAQDAVPALEKLLRHFWDTGKWPRFKV